MVIGVVGLGLMAFQYVKSFRSPPERTLILPEPLRPTVRRFGEPSPGSKDAKVDASNQLGHRAYDEGVSSGELMDELVAVINEARQKGTRCAGNRYPAVAPVRISQALEEAAGGQATWMVEASDYAHRTPGNPLGRTPEQRVRAVGYTGVFVGENLAWGQASPRQALRWWLGSTAHCRTLMAADANEVGIGVEEDPETSRGYVWVMVYGNQ